MATPASIVRGLRATPRWLGVLLLLLWAGLIFHLSSEPPEHPGVVHDKVRAWLMNLCHAPEYGVLTLLFLVASADRAAGLVAGRRRLLVALLFALAYGASDEFHQSFTPGRDASVCDILTDLGGAWLTAALAQAVERGAGAARIARVLAIGVPACLLAALIATFVPEQFPKAPWL